MGAAMSESLDQMDENAVRLMQEENLITADQARRLRVVLGKGKTMREALQTVPLVEPLIYLRIQRAASADEIAPKTSFQNELINAETPGGAAGKPRLVGFGKREPANILDFDSIDLEGTGFLIAPITGPMNESSESFELGGLETDVASSNTPVRLGEMADPKRILAIQSLEEVDDVDSYMQTTTAGQVYDLAEDDGIPLLKKLHGLLMELTEMAGRGLVVEWPGGGSGEVRFYSESGKLGMQRGIEGEEAAKLINRLKIMAHIEPWRRDSPRGSFIIKVGDNMHRIMLRVMTRSDDAETATAYLRPV